MNEQDPLIGQTIADRYQVLQLLGAGGMGRVYLAEHVRMGRKSALKVMNPALAAAADAISRFNREAANASRINHPNVAQIYDFGETADGLLYLAMEFIEGETLTRIIEREGPLPLGRAAGITKQVADALQAAHHLDIVHRDLKPENIMVARHLDGSDWVKVVDFGIAKTTQQSGGSQTVTTAGVSLGTPEYMSPEQLAGERLDARSDIYALGLVCFNMLTGDLPYPRLTSRETLVKRLTSPPRRLDDVNPDVPWPVELQAALDRALAPETKDRYANVAEFGRDVLASVTAFDADRTVRIAPRRILSSEPTTKRNPATRQASVKAKAASAARGRRSLAGAAIVIVAALAFGAWRMRPAQAHLPQPVPRSTVAEVRQSAIAALPVPPRPDSATVSASAVVKTDSAPPPAAPARNAAAAAQKPPLVRHDSQPSRHNRAAPRPGTTPLVGQGIANRRATEPPRDTVPAAAPPRADSAAAPVWTSSPRGRQAGPHPWLRANGDSGSPRMLPANASVDDRVLAFSEEINGHIQRAGQFASRSQYQQARQNFTEAARELGFLRQLIPNAPELPPLQRSLRQSVTEAYQQCQAARGADTTFGFRCEALLPMNNRGRNGRANQAAQPSFP